MSCLSKANLQMTVGMGVPAFSGHPFEKSSTRLLINWFLTKKREMHTSYFIKNNVYKTTKAQNR